MPLLSGLVGLPNVGKSTLFNALTKAKALVANYPFSTIEPHVGVAELADERLDAVVQVVEPKEVVPAVAHFVDIAGLVKGASKGEGLGNQFLGQIRNVDAIVHVVRCFANADVVHVNTTLDPLRDIEVVETELALADLQAIERRMERAVRDVKTGEQSYKEELAALELLQQGLEKGEPARSYLNRLPISSPEREACFWRDLPLLTAKPVVYCANVSEDDVQGNGALAQQVATYAAAHAAGFVPICAQVEAELVDLPPEDMQAFLQEMGLMQPGLGRLAAAAYKQLGLITFYTVKGPQTRAWSILAGTPAPQAAGKIHSDMERGFIRAEVVAWDALVQSGSFQRAKEKGLVRVEGKEYLIQDGDVVQFRFNV